MFTLDVHPEHPPAAQDAQGPPAPREWGPVQTSQQTGTKVGNTFTLSSVKKYSHFFRNLNLRDGKDSYESSFVSVCIIIISYYQYNVRK